MRKTTLSIEQPNIWSRHWDGNRTSAHSSSGIKLFGSRRVSSQYLKSKGVSSDHSHEPLRLLSPIHACWSHVKFLALSFPRYVYGNFINSEITGEIRDSSISADVQINLTFMRLWVTHQWMPSSLRESSKRHMSRVKEIETLTKGV